MNTMERLEWELERDRLIALKNEHADAVCRILASNEHNALSGALLRHEQWKAVDQQFAAHMEKANG